MGLTPEHIARRVDAHLIKIGRRTDWDKLPKGRWDNTLLEEIVDETLRIERGESLDRIEDVQPVRKLASGMYVGDGRGLVLLSPEFHDRFPVEVICSKEVMGTKWFDKDLVAASLTLPGNHVDVMLLSATGYTVYYACKDRGVPYEDGVI